MRPTRAAKATDSRTELLTGRYSSVPLFRKSTTLTTLTVATPRAFLHQVWMHKYNTHCVNEDYSLVCL